MQKSLFTYFKKSGTEGSPQEKANPTEEPQKGAKRKREDAAPAQSKRRKLNDNSEQDNTHVPVVPSPVAQEEVKTSPYFAKKSNVGTSPSSKFTRGKPISPSPNPQVSTPVETKKPSPQKINKIVEEEEEEEEEESFVDRRRSSRARKTLFDSTSMFSDDDGEGDFEEAPKKSHKGGSLSKSKDTKRKPAQKKKKKPKDEDEDDDEFVPTAGDDEEDSKYEMEDIDAVPEEEEEGEGDADADNDDDDGDKEFSKKKGRAPALKRSRSNNNNSKMTSMSPSIPSRAEARGTLGYTAIPSHQALAAHGVASSTSSIQLSGKSAKVEVRFPWLENVRDAEKRPPTHPDYDPSTLYIPDDAYRILTGFEQQVRKVSKNKNKKQIDCD
jgi:DNA mismatch repair protein MSH6